ncbi:hypothetical protein [Loigolactobacillus bifermentans]|nr:hypothetical protein [Loigolactobacillus bifermentans]QGG60569.1 hypothetical protein LB003_08895 [Loigolactobacillus bifermentans]
MSFQTFMAAFDQALAKRAGEPALMVNFPVILQLQNEELWIELPTFNQKINQGVLGFFTPADVLDHIYGLLTVVLMGAKKAPKEVVLPQAPNRVLRQIPIPNNVVANHTFWA